MADQLTRDHHLALMYHPDKVNSSKNPHSGYCRF